MFSSYKNISDAIIKTCLSIDYTKRKINKLFMYIITLVLRFLCNLAVTSIVYTGNFWIDFPLEIAIGVIFILYTPKFYTIVTRYKSDILELSRYLIDNYNEENFRLWKLYVVFPTATFTIAYLCLFEITSFLLIQYIVQFLLCYLIVDNIENREGILVDAYNAFRYTRNVKIYDKQDIVFIENYKEPQLEFNDTNKCDIEDFQVL